MSDGAHIMRGYWNNESGTRNLLQPGDISGEILALDGIMTVVSFTGVGTIPALFYFVIIRSEAQYFPGIRNGVNDVRGVRVDNTRVHIKVHKVYNIKVVNE